MENQLKDPTKVSKRTKTDFGEGVELPAEFECCFCSTDVSQFYDISYLLFYFWLSLIKKSKNPSIQPSLF